MAHFCHEPQHSSGQNSALDVDPSCQQQAASERKQSCNAKVSPALKQSNSPRQRAGVDCRNNASLRTRVGFSTLVSMSSVSRARRLAAGLSDAPAISIDPAALTSAIAISTNLAVIGGALTMSSNVGMVSEIAANRYLVVASWVHVLSSRSFPF